MVFEFMTSDSTTNFNKYNLYLEWPRTWIIVLGSILTFLSVLILGMEIGHTVADAYRSTAFGGFITIIPFIICSFFVLVTAFKPSLTILHTTVILCCIIILLCVALIAYDILVLVDPSRCFLLNCNDASVYISNSTYNLTVTGWPLYITWPSYFQTNMNAKRILQSIQLACAVLFILFTCLYILTFIIYRYIRLNEHTLHSVDSRTFLTNEKSKISQTKNSDKESLSFYSSYTPKRKVTTYMIDGGLESRDYYYSESSASPVQMITVPKQTKIRILRPRASSLNYNRLCTRCHREYQSEFKTSFERKNFFSNLCRNCNNDIFRYRRPVKLDKSVNNALWKP